MPKAMRHLQAELEIEDQPLIAFNGGLISHYKEQQLVHHLSIEVPLSITLLILQFTNSTSIHTSLYHADEWYVPQMDYWANREMVITKVTPEVADLNNVWNAWNDRKIGPHKIMCMGEAEEIQLLENYIQTHFKTQLNAYRSKPTYLEISSKDISKLSALSHLLENHFNHQLSDVIAFGDNYNDVEMISGVGMGVAVENAKDEVKLVANKIAESNVNDGVAKILKMIFI
jgi:hypothetical protein